MKASCSGNRNHITVVGCVCANGSSVPPFFIMKGRKDVVVSNNRNETLSGFSNMFTFKNWVQFLIDNLATNERKGENILLIMDGYSSHINDIESIEMLERNRVRFFLFLFVFFFFFCCSDNFFFKKCLRGPNTLTSRGYKT